MVCADGIRQFGDKGGMRDWGLLIIVCLVLVVSASLGPVEHEGVRTQCTMDIHGVLSGSGDTRVQRDSNSLCYQQDASVPHNQQDFISPRSQHKTAAVFGKMEEFDEAKEDWPQYVKRLEHFIEANGIVEEGKKRSIFLTLVGPTVFKLIRSLASPARPGELVKLLREHYRPTLLKTVQRFKFHSRFRKPGESVAAFVAELRPLAESCNFGASLETVL